MLTNALYILLAILMLGIIILVHEFGHFIAGRLSGIAVLEFSIGFGPKLLGWSRKGTDYSLRAIPLGGYCKFLGEDEDNPAPNSMNHASVWKRFITVFAGAAMNFVLAFVAAVILHCFFFVAAVYPVIDTVEPNTPAQTIALQSGDRITAADGVEIANNDDGVNAFRDIIAHAPVGEPIALTVDRAGEAINLSITPAIVDEATQKKQIGVVFQSKGYGLLEAIPASGSYMLDITKEMLGALKNLFFKGEGIEDTAGPVGTISLISETVREGSYMIFWLLFLLSLNVGIINLMPFPALDGGRLVFILIEAIRGKPIPPEKEGMVHAIGMLFILALFVFLTYNDIVRIFTR